MNFEDIVPQGKIFKSNMVSEASGAGNGFICQLGENYHLFAVIDSENPESIKMAKNKWRTYVSEEVISVIKMEKSQQEFNFTDQEMQIVIKEGLWKAAAKL